MMFIRKPVMVESCALATKLATAFWSRVLGSMCIPAPGWTIWLTTMPTIRASVENVRKYSMALPATRPTFFKSLMPAMPDATVRKITGAMIIFTSLMKASPNGCICWPSSGLNAPSSTPTTMAKITCTYRI
ncbi:hypothetical protein D3C77_634920 [compost metagenome]